jgi:hypothetical protein
LSFIHLLKKLQPAHGALKVELPLSTELLYCTSTHAVRGSVSYSNLLGKHLLRLSHLMKGFSHWLWDVDGISPEQLDQHRQLTNNIS